MDRHVMTTTAPHPDHFDATKFDANGRRIVTERGKVGKRSRLRPGDVEQVLSLDSNSGTPHLVDFLIAKGFDTQASQERLLRRLRNGWRPKR